MSYILENIDEFKRLERQAQQGHYSLKEELKHLSLSPNQVVLDAGCGSGLLSRYLADHFSNLQLMACDQSDLRLQQAKEASAHRNIQYFQSDLSRLDLADESVDAVVCRFVYEYLQDPLQVTREFHRVLKPGGVAYLIDLDGVFLNYWTTNDKLNRYVEHLRNDLNIDLYVGRKLFSFLHSAHFQKVDYHVSLHDFKSDSEVEEEFVNNRDRILFAKDSLLESLGSEAAYEDFQDCYLAEMKSKSSTMFFNKFVAWGQKA